MSSIGGGGGIFSGVAHCTAVVIFNGIKSSQRYQVFVLLLLYQALVRCLIFLGYIIEV